MHEGDNMKIAYCCPGAHAGCEKVKRILEILVAADSFEIFSTLPDFERFLRHDLTSGHLIILHASLMQHLEQFVSLREWLIDHRVILILPDHSRDNIIRGHMLRPRFITYNDSDYLEMAAVLQNLLHPQTADMRLSSPGKL